MIISRLFSKTVFGFLTVLFTTNSFAGGGTVTFGANAVPTLSGTMLVILSLLLLVVAIKIARRNDNTYNKFLVGAIGVSALLGATSDVKVLSDVQAGGAVITVSGASSHTVPDGSNATFQNTGTSPLNFSIVADTSTSGNECGFDIRNISSSFSSLTNYQTNHSGQLPANQELFVECRVTPR